MEEPKKPDETTNTDPVEPTVSKDKKKGKPSVEEQLALVLEKLESLEAAGKLKDDKIAVLEAVADKGRMYAHESKNRKALVHVVKLTTIEDKIIVSWRSVVDEVYKDGRGEWHEKQIQEFTDEDGKKYTLDMFDLGRKIVKIEADVLARRKVLDDFDTGIEKYEYDVQTRDGRKFTLSETFIN